MAQESTLNDAVTALHTEYGDSFAASRDQGKEMMTLTLQDRLHVSREDAAKLVDAAIDAHSIRWEGKTANLPIEQTGVTPAASGRAETGTWYL